MSEYGCSICYYVSDKKSNMKKHINKKNKCGENPQIVEIPIEIVCEHCEKCYATKSGLKRHLKTCKVKKANVQKLLDEKDREIEKLKAKLEAKSQPIINNYIQNNIIVNGYKNTDFSKLTDRHFSSALNRTLMSVPQMIEYTHFNENIPENQNIYINNIKGKYAMVYDGNEWCIKDQNEAINRLINDQEYALEDWVNRVGEQDPKVIEKFKRYLNVKEKDGAEEAMKEEVRMMLYNKRNLFKNK